ncbi:hypothetical protein D020_3842B, partial [Vibrio parahaemolyticus SBR10290]
ATFTRRYYNNACHFFSFLD